MPYITESCNCPLCRGGADIARDPCGYCGDTACDGRECRECEYCGSIYCEDMECQRCGDCGCTSCECDEYSDYSGSSSNGLMPYSYSPELTFYGEETEPNKTFYGLEIEVSASYSTMRSAVPTATEALGPLGYLKEDGSVNGFEICCQPMSYDWAMANFPWKMFAALDSDGCDIEPHTNGIHVHVSRAGFSSPAHLYRWMKFWYRNESDITRIARRRPGQWSRYDSEHRDAHLAHAKKHGKPAPRRRDRYERNDNYDATMGTRYSAINTTNEHTLEVRVFASTLDATEAQSCLALVSASVEYTRQLRAHDVAAGDGWSWEAFRKFITASGDKYAALATIDGNH